MTLKKRQYDYQRITVINEPLTFKCKELNEEKTYYKRIYSKIPENEMNFLNIDTKSDI